jgi:hypothetical protein
VRFFRIDIGPVAAAGHSGTGIDFPGELRSFRAAAIGCATWHSQGVVLVCVSQGRVAERTGRPQQITALQNRACVQTAVREGFSSPPVHLAAARFRIKSRRCGGARLHQSDLSSRARTPPTLANNERTSLHTGPSIPPPRRISRPAQRHFSNPNPLQTTIVAYFSTSPQNNPQYLLRSQCQEQPLRDLTLRVMYVMV